MDILREIFLWIVYSSISASIISLIIILIKKFAKKYITPRLQHTLWFLVLIKLLVPFSFQSDISLFNLFPQDNISTIYENSSLSKIYLREERLNIRQMNDISEDVNEYIDKVNSEEEKVSLKDKATDISIYLWVTGVVLLGGVVTMSSIIFKKSEERFIKVDDLKVINILNLAKNKLKLKNNIFIYTSDKIKTPFIYGTLTPRIYIPKQVLSSCSESELTHIILHELIHYKRKDLIWNLLSILSIVIHWFNPIVWVSMKKMREDREVACDSLVLETIGEEEIEDYGMTIITLSKFQINNNYKKLMSVYFYEDKNQIERRIRVIKLFKRGSYKVSIRAVLAITLLSAVTLTNSSGYTISKNANTATNIEQKAINVYKELDASNKKFNNLERAVDFINFELRVPDYIPKEYEMYDVNIEKDNKIKIDFGRDIRDTNNNEEHFSYIVSKENIVKNIKERFKDSIIEEKSMTISDIKGINLVQKRKLKNVSNELVDPYIIEKFFIWKSDSLWYGIGYYTNHNIYEEEEYLSEISKKDMEKIISSLKDIKDISNVKYTSKPLEQYFDIYGEKDLKKAEKELGFTPKFKLNLSEGLTMKSSRVGEILYYLNERGGEYEKTRDFNSYYAVKDNLEAQVNFHQVKKYKDDYFEKLEEAKTNDLEKINIDGVEVFRYEKKEEHYYNRITDELQENVKLKIYEWEQDGILYTVNINEGLDNEDEIVKAFIR